MSIPHGYHIKSKNKKKFTPVNCLLVTIFIAICISGIAFIFIQTWYIGGLNAVDSSNQTIVKIKIEKGLSSGKIGQLLLDKKLISNLSLWDIYMKISGSGPKLLADRYELPSNISMLQIVDTLSRPQKKKIIWVTFPEGIRYSDMGDILKKVEQKFTNGFNVPEFLHIAEYPNKISFNNKEVDTFLNKYKPGAASLEGFLYPDTYAFEPEMSTKDVVEFMLKEFISKVKNINKDHSNMEFYDMLKLASIVDQESHGRVDRAKVASVFINRLNVGMKLQSDATVNYVTHSGMRRSTLKDIQINSPYNTYKSPGLPPTPINNPRIESIQVVADPIKTDFLFFLHELDGTPHFAITLDGHNNNVNKYLEN